MEIGKKRKKSMSNTKKEEEKDKIAKRGVDFSIGKTLVACSNKSNTNTITSRIICLQGESYVEKEMDWFILKLPIEDLYNDLKGIRRDTSWFRKVAAFNHQCLHADQGDATVLYPMLSCQKRFGGKGTVVPLRGNTLACLGSTIFTIGGNTKYHYGDKKKKKGSNLVHYFDTTQMSGSSEGPAWRQAPSMIIARYNPQVVVLDQKLYVFGCSSVHRCNHKTRCGVWAEVFDPKDDDGRLGVGRWRPLPEPPSPLLEEGYFVVVSPPTDLEGKLDNNSSSKKKKILVFTSKTAYEFDVANHCWTVSKSDFHCRWGGHDVNPPVMVDDVLYWFENELRAYDIHKGVSFVGPVQDLLFHRCLLRTNRRDGLSEPQRPAIVHLGGRYFCLLLCVSDAAASSDRGHIHCLIIKASRTKDRYQQHEHKCMTSPEFFLSVSVVSCQSFPIYRLLHFLDGRIMLI